MLNFDFWLKQVFSLIKTNIVSEPAAPRLRRWSLLNVLKTGRRPVIIPVRSGHLARKEVEPESNRLNRRSDRRTGRTGRFPSNRLAQFFFSSQHPRSYSHCRRSLECRLVGSSPHALESPPPKCCKAPSPATQPPIPRGCSHCCRQCLKYQKILAIFLKNRGVRVREI